VSQDPLVDHDAQRSADRIEQDEKPLVESITIPAKATRIPAALRMVSVSCSRIADRMATKTGRTLTITEVLEAEVS
jgi:hypothetical protein